MSYPNPLSNIDLAVYAPNVPVLMRDSPDLTGQPLRTCIINLDDMTGPGTHWVAIHSGPTAIYYFDSFGIQPPPEIVELHREEPRRLMFNTSHIQSPQSTMCGWYCLMFLDQMDGGKTFYDFIYQFDRSNRNINESIIHRWAKARHRRIIHSKGTTIKYKLAK